MIMLGRIKLYAFVSIVLIGAVLIVLASWRWYLIDNERTRAALEAARDFRETIERIGNADVGTGDADDDLRWLGERLRKSSPQ
jgi:hypothetical protein